MLLEYQVPASVVNSRVQEIRSARPALRSIQICPHRILRILRKLIVSEPIRHPDVGFFSGSVRSMSGSLEPPDMSATWGTSRLWLKCRECRVLAAGVRREVARRLDTRNRIGAIRSEAEPQLWTPSGRQTRVLSRSAGCKSLRNLVGLPGFEPGTSCTPSKRASQAAPQPDMFYLTT